MLERQNPSIRAPIIPLLGAGILLSAGPARADDVVLLKPSFADSPWTLKLNRNSQFMAIYTVSGTYHAVTGATSNPLGTEYTIPNKRFFESGFSNWGMALVTDNLGGTPVQVYAAPLGQPLELIHTGTSNSAYNGPAMTDDGIIAFTGRDTNSTGMNLLYQRVPGQPAVLVPANGSDQMTQATMIDSLGRITVASQYSAPAYHVQLDRFTSGSSLIGGWEDLTAGFPDTVSFEAGNIWSGNAAGQVTFPADFISGGQTRRGIYLFNGTTSVRILDRTRPWDGNPYESYATLADNGAVLILEGPAVFGSLNWQTYLRNPDGSILDLETLLPAGRIEPYRPSVDISFDGGVLLEAQKLSDNTFEYFRYDDAGLHLLLGGLTTRLVSPQLGNDDNMYFLREESSGKYSLLQTVVPEPSAAGVILLALWPRLARRRCRDST